MKMDASELMDDLLVKWMLGEASDAEQTQVKNWLLMKEENRHYYAHFKLIWERSKELATQSPVDENDAWVRFKAKVEPEVRVMALRKNTLYGFLRIAAMLLCMLGTGWLIYFFSMKGSSSHRVTLESRSKTLTDTLPDGSVVTLNKRSSISYPEDFNRASVRKITLNGEAFFHVRPDKTRPFVITVDEVTVTVVGTSFNVKSSVQKTEVVVETGLVEVEKAEQKIRVSPSESVTVVKGRKELVMEKTRDQFYDYYRTKKFVCRDTPLWRLVEILNEAYQADIVIGHESLRDRQINTTFKEQPLPEILRIIGVTLDIQVEQKGDQIILK